MKKIFLALIVMLYFFSLPAYPGERPIGAKTGVDDEGKFYIIYKFKNGSRFKHYDRKRYKRGTDGGTDKWLPPEQNNNSQPARRSPRSLWDESITTR